MREQIVAGVLDKLAYSVDVPQLEAVDALALTGSRARGESDRYSDLDLLVVLKEEYEMTSAVQAFADYIGPAGLLRGPVFVPHFGYSTTMILKDLVICQANFNYIGDIECNKMRASSKIIFDRNGELTQVINDAKLLTSDLEEVFRDQFTYFWIRLLFAKRSLDRGEIWRSIGYLADVRQAMLQMVRLREGIYSDSTSPHSPATRLEQLVNPEVAIELKPALPSYSPEEVSQCIRWCSFWFDKQSRKCIWHAIISAEMHQVVQAVMEEVAL